MIDWMPICLSAIIVLVSSILQSGTGFGFSIISVPFLINVLPVHEAIEINLIITLVISLAMFRATRKDIDKTLLKNLIWSSLAGIPIGVLIYLFIPVLWIKLILACSILFLALLLALRFHFIRTAGKDIITGFLSGVLTSSIGVPGPPLLVYTNGTDMNKSTVRSTTLAFYIVVYFFSISSQFIINGISYSIALTTVLLLPFVFLGMWLGQYVFFKLTQTMFKWIQYSILIFTGLYLFYTVLFE